jgi:hypothetical protein
MGERERDVRWLTMVSRWKLPPLGPLIECGSPLSYPCAEPPSSHSETGAINLSPTYSFHYAGVCCAIKTQWERRQKSSIAGRLEWEQNGRLAPTLMGLNQKALCRGAHCWWRCHFFSVLSPGCVKQSSGDIWESAADYLRGCMRGSHLE